MNEQEFQRLLREGQEALRRSAKTLSQVDAPKAQSNQTNDARPKRVTSKAPPPIKPLRGTHNWTPSDSWLKESDFARWAKSRNSEILHDELKALQQQRENLLAAFPRLEGLSDSFSVVSQYDVSTGRPERQFWDLSRRVESLKLELIGRGDVSAPQAESSATQAAGELYPRLNYRSVLKRAIALILTKRPDATDLQICRELDADGSADLPQTWKKSNQDRLFVDAYSDSQRRHRVEIKISKVRADMRARGLLAPR